MTFLQTLKAKIRLSNFEGVNRTAESPLMVERLLGAIGGLVVGALLGLIALFLTLIITGSNLGLDNILIGGVIGGSIGLLLGFCFPWATARVFIFVLNIFP